MIDPIPYLSAGLRRYGEYPVRPYGRPTWELQCVVRGRARPSPGEDPSAPARPLLRIFPPNHLHGWTAPPRDTSEIIVIHVNATFDLSSTHAHATAAAESFVLSEWNLLRLRTLFDWIAPHFIERTVTGETVLAAGVVFLQSFLEELRRADSAQATKSSDDAVRRVDDARHLYRESITRNPSVQEISAALGVSASQLRRSFSRAGEPPPRQVFRSIQFDYARRLLAGSREPIWRVAEELGFEGLSAFTRAFTNHFGHSPGRVRRPADPDVTEPKPAPHRAQSRKPRRPKAKPRPPKSAPPGS